MNIKSLLLGSAAALVAVSGARAADAVEVVAEPEPAEYVRICDTYGTGYYYIPGTETCLRIGGYVRYDIGVGALGGTNDVFDRGGDGLNDTYSKNARFSLQTWTGTETELGTLSTYTETRFNFGNSKVAVLGDHDEDPETDPEVIGYDNGTAGSWSLNYAWIQLGGFRVGKDESAFTTFAGYAGGVMNDSVIGFGSFDTNLISYTFDAGNGFSAIVALEQGSDVDTIDSYVPHVVGGVKYTGGWGAATLVGGYDSNYEEFAVKGRVDVNVNEQLSLFAMAAWGSQNEDVTKGRNFYKAWNGDWAVWGGASYKASEKATINIQGAYTDGGDFVDDGQFSIAANVAYTLVPGFKITPEVLYTDLNNDDNDGEFGGFLRFQRDF